MQRGKKCTTYILLVRLDKPRVLRLRCRSNKLRPSFPPLRCRLLLQPRSTLRFLLFLQLFLALSPGKGLTLARASPQPLALCTTPPIVARSGASVLPNHVPCRTSFLLKGRCLGFFGFVSASVDHPLSPPRALLPPRRRAARAAAFFCALDNRGCEVAPE